MEQEQQDCCKRRRTGCKRNRKGCRRNRIGCRTSKMGNTVHDEQRDGQNGIAGSTAEEAG